MVRHRVAAVCSLFLGTSTALAENPRVFARMTLGAWSTAPVQARVGERVELAVRFAGAHGTSRPLPEGARVAWERVVPLPEHRDFPSPNPGLRSFSNAVLFGPRHGHWIGYDRLEYDALPLDGTTDTRIVTTAGDDHGGAGSAWFSALVTLPDGTTLRTPGAADVDALGLSASVLRVSFRSGDDYLGWLSTYFHVPGVFGSNGPSDAAHQADRYTGADCADVLVGALRASGDRSAHYTSVAGIGTYATPRTRALRIGADGAVRDARGPVDLRWGTDIAPGDLVTLDYAADTTNLLPRDWDHIGALVGDRNGNGILDGADTLRHDAVHGLDDTPLTHAGPMRLVVWRWRTGRSRGAVHERP